MTLIHNRHQMLYKVFTTFGQNSTILQRAYTGDQYFSRIKIIHYFS
jgi:hypothetical protein